jgi:hypothetical protein
MTFYMIYGPDGPIPQTLRTTEREAWKAYSGELSTEETIAKLQDWGLTCRRVEVVEQGNGGV